MSFLFVKLSCVSVDPGAAEGRGASAVARCGARRPWAQDGRPRGRAGLRGLPSVTTASVVHWHGSWAPTLTGRNPEAVFCARVSASESGEHRRLYNPSSQHDNVYDHSYFKTTLAGFLSVRDSSWTVV